jgi:hypothetical protein
MLRIIFTLVALILTLLSACRCATPPAPPKAVVVEDAGSVKAVVEDAATKPASAPAAVKK